MVKRFLAFIGSLFSKFKILDRYLLAEVAGPFFFGMIGFVVIGMFDLVFSLVDMFINNGVPFLVVMKILIYKIPAIMVLFYPMAVLFATLIVLIRLAKDSEITVLRAGGLSLGRIVLPIVVAGFLAFGLSYLTNEKVVPWANNISDEILSKAMVKKPSPDILENTFFKESDNRFFYVKKIHKDRREMENIVIHETTDDFPRVITAKTANYEGQLWRLHDGIVYSYDPTGLLRYQGKFEEMTIWVDQQLYNYYRSEKGPREMNAKELKQKIKKLQSSGAETNVLNVEYHMKFSLPMASFIFALIGTAIVLIFIRSSKDLWGVVIAVLTALLSVGFYFFVMATFRSLARGGYIGPFWGAWGPNLLFGMAAIAIIIHQSRSR